MSRNKGKNRHRAEVYASPEEDNADSSYQSVSYQLSDYPEYIMGTNDTIQPSDLSTAIGSSEYPEDARLEQAIHSLSFAEDAPYTEYSAHYAGETSASYNEATIDPVAAFGQPQAHLDLYETGESYHYAGNTATNAANYTDHASGSGYQQPAEREKQAKHQCPMPNCAKAFRRAADLDRHYKHVHGEESRQEHNACDYPKCQRRGDPFSRKDHLRDHLRDFHKEDLPRRTREPKVDETWWAARIVSPKWWRCSRCLRRILLDEHGWDCPKCQSTCEEERRQLREGRQ